MHGQTVLITGANRGIGLAFAEACAREGAVVWLAVRARDMALEERLRGLGAAEVRTLVGDLVTREGVEDLVRQVDDVRVDILFNNAGLLTGGLIEEQPLDDIYKMFQVNVNALVHLSRALVPGMVKRGRGKIINHASVSAVMHFPCASTYAAGKAAVWAFSDCLNRELKGTGVSVLCLFTPGIKTRMFDKIEDLYSKNFETPKDSITPEEYALRILRAVKDGREHLVPVGATGWAFFVARHFPRFFGRVVGTRFRRG